MKRKSYQRNFFSSFIKTQGLQKGVILKSLGNTKQKN